MTSLKAAKKRIRFLNRNNQRNKVLKKKKKNEKSIKKKKHAHHSQVNFKFDGVLACLGSRSRPLENSLVIHERCAFRIN